MANNMLHVKDAGYGTTPTPENAKFAIGQSVEARRTDGKWFAATVTAVVPPGHPPEYALHDVLEQPRPLMITRNRKRSVTYIIRRPDEAEGRYDWVHEKNLRALAEQRDGRNDTTE